MRTRFLTLVAFALIVAGCATAGSSPSSEAASNAPTAAATATPSAAPTASPAATSSPDATTGACPAGEAGFRELAPALDRTLRLDGETITLTTAGIANRSGDFQVDDAISQWGDLSAQTPIISAATDSTGRLVGSPGMSLSSGTVAIFPASEFDFAASRFPDPATVTPTELTVENGELAVPYPAQGGRWVLAFHVDWQTECLVGDGVAFAIVETR